MAGGGGGGADQEPGERPAQVGGDSRRMRARDGVSLCPLSGTWGQREAELFGERQSLTSGVGWGGDKTSQRKINSKNRQHPKAPQGRAVTNSYTMVASGPLSSLQEKEAVLEGGAEELRGCVRAQKRGSWRGTRSAVAGDAPSVLSTRGPETAAEPAASGGVRRAGGLLPSITSQRNCAPFPTVI